MRILTIAILTSATLLTLNSCREPSGSLINTTAPQTTFETAVESTVETAYSEEKLETTAALAQLFNENSDFDFPLLTPWNDAKNTEGFTELYGFGGAGLESDNGLTKYTFAGYPDVLDEWVMIEFSTTDPEHSVIGISCGMSTYNAAKILTDTGFLKINIAETNNIYLYERDGWRIILDISSGEVTRILIRFLSTNITGAQF